MPGKPPLTRFASRPTMPLDCVFRAYNAPYNAFVGVLNVPSDFCGNSSGYFESFRRPLQDIPQGGTVARGVFPEPIFGVCAIVLRFRAA